MIICTSLSPSHLCKENQSKAIESWNKYGNCYSLNHPKEIGLLDYNKITFIPTSKTVDLIIGKPLIGINSMLDFALQKESDLLIINSDIIIHALPEFKNDGVTLISRNDYDSSFADARVFHAGFDVFYIPNKFLSMFPPSIYSMGCAWWDYWIPKWAMTQGIKLYYPKGKFAFHKVHKTQYNHEEWLRIGEYFRWEFKLSQALSIPQIATKTLGEIKSKLI